MSKKPEEIVSEIQVPDVVAEAVLAQQKIEAIITQLLNTFNSTPVIKDLNEISSVISHLANAVLFVREGGPKARNPGSSRRR